VNGIYVPTVLKDQSRADGNVVILDGATIPFCGAQLTNNCITDDETLKESLFRQAHRKDTKSPPGT